MKQTYAGGTAKTSTNRQSLKSIHIPLLDQLQQLPPAILEQRVRVLLVRMGYKILEKSDKDGFLILDSLGFHIIYVKIWAFPYAIPGRPYIKSFVGEIIGKGAHSGLLLTPMWFSGPALEYAEAINPRVILKDGQGLVQLFTQFGLSI